eukprot:12215226-Alexandrium_andersonii.AAC.1
MRTGCATSPRAERRIRSTEQIAGGARLLRFGGRRSSTTRPRGTRSLRKRGTAGPAGQSEAVATGVRGRRGPAGEDRAVRRAAG